MDDEDVLFTYGTLRQPEVQRATFGRLLDGWADAVVGFELATVTITDPYVIATSGSDRHPVLRPGGPDAVVEGLALPVSATDLASADEYEVDAYTRVRVPLLSGRQAWVYVLAEAQHP